MMADIQEKRYDGIGNKSGIGLGTVDPEARKKFILSYQARITKARQLGKSVAWIEMVEGGLSENEATFIEMVGDNAGNTLKYLSERVGRDPADLAGALIDEGETMELVVEFARLCSYPRRLVVQERFLEELEFVVEWIEMS
jgi:hypothetical protein